MRDITSAAVAARSTVVRPVAEVTSWLGSQFLGDVPVLGGRAGTDMSIVGGDLELEVPNRPEWVPTHPAHPLAAFGQELRVRWGWAGPDGEPWEWATIGRYMIRRAVPEGERITVRADGLGQRVENDRFTAPFTVAAGPIHTQARALLTGSGLRVTVDTALLSRTSAARTWERGGSRAEAWAEVMAAWPAVAKLDPDARGFHVRAPYATTGAPVATYRDGEGGSVVTVAPGGGPEDGPPNAVVASTAPEDGSVPLSAIAVTNLGPRRWGGMYGRRPAFFSSPLLTTQAQVRAAAATRLASMQAQTWDMTVGMLSCPAVEPGDLVRVIYGSDTDVIGQVVASRLALTAEGEPGEISVMAVSGRLSGVTL